MPHDPIIAPAPEQTGRSAEEVVLDFVRSGVFRVDERGCAWRCGLCRDGRTYPCPPRRAENRTPLGYLQLRVMVDGRRYHVGAHRIVWWHFRGPIPMGLVINHINGRKDDNRPENLECVTYSENMRHAHRTGLKDQRGQRNPAAKLADKHVAEIRLAYSAGGITQAQLAGQYGVNFRHISRIVRGERRASQLGPISVDDHRHNACDRDPMTGRFVAGTQGDQ